MVKTLDFEPASPPAPVEFGALTNFKILLVEDSPDNQALISIFLKKYGASVEIATDGAEAVKAAFQGKFDVVLMDVQMPVLDGLSAVKILRQRGYQKPIVALTAHAMSEERQRCINAGFSDFLTKPLQRNVLMSMLAQIRSQN
jgi:CheY-like chemotaxis protein